MFFLIGGHAPPQAYKSESLQFPISVLFIPLYMVRLVVYQAQETKGNFERSSAMD